MKKDFFKKLQEPDDEFVSSLGATSMLAPLGMAFLVIPIYFGLSSLGVGEGPWLKRFCFIAIIGTYGVMKFLQIFAQEKLKRQETAEEQ